MTTKGQNILCHLSSFWVTFPLLNSLFYSQNSCSQCADTHLLQVVNCWTRYVLYQYEPVRCSLSKLKCLTLPSISAFGFFVLFRLHLFLLQILHHSDSACVSKPMSVSWLQILQNLNLIQKWLDFLLLNGENKSLKPSAFSFKMLYTYVLFVDNYHDLWN